jgi:hypothetical protein
MAYSPLPPLDNLSNREWVDLTGTQENLIKFCQTVGLLPSSMNEPCSQGHDAWQISRNSRACDQYSWRCKICRSTRTLREKTFFSHSKLKLEQLVDLMYYWSQGLDSHIYLTRHCGITSDTTIVDWKNFIRDICVEHCIKHPAKIGGDNHIVEIDESAWTKRKYNRG